MFKGLFNGVSLPTLIVTVVLVASSLLSYHWWARHHGMQRVGVVDIASVVAAKEKEFTALASKPGVTDADRQKAFEMVKSFAADLGAVMKALPDECECLVLNSAAVVGGNTEDLTPQVMKKLRL